MSTSKSEPRYRLVIFDAIEDPPALRDLVASATGMHPTDAVQWLARTPGVWGRELDEATVRTLLDGLYEHKIAAEAWRSDQLPDLGTPRTFHRGACLDEGLRVEGLRGEPTHWVPWDCIELIAAGTVLPHADLHDATTARWSSALVSGIRALAFRGPRRFERRPPRANREAVGEVLILRRDPRIVFRVVENQMNYAYLGARLRNSAAENFPIFLADLCARADAAHLTPSTRALLGREDGGAGEAEAEFPSSQALLDYAFLRLLWSWYRRDGEAQAT